ncbi:MAG: acyl-coenzyme A thioesterase PaaI-like protein [Arenicella sp.]|jgi:acyl-coenzyme A thioesterase PaaI-like protein
MTMSSIYLQFLKLNQLPGGKFLFSKAIGFAAPFFGKIKPKVIDLRPGYCKVEMKDRWGVRNHIGTVNAGALCSLAELTGGMALDSLVPNELRWIPRTMTVSYIKKATGTLSATSRLAAKTLQAGDIIVPISVKNRTGDEVFTADITFYLSSKL